jgi:hypothetical protein
MFRKKKAIVRILDSPLRLQIFPEVILVPYTDGLAGGQILMITGNFEHITDQEAYRLAADATDKFRAA